VAAIGTKTKNESYSLFGLVSWCDGCTGLDLPKLGLISLSQPGIIFLWSVPLARTNGINYY